MEKTILGQIVKKICGGNIGVKGGKKWSNMLEKENVRDVASAVL